MPEAEVRSPQCRAIPEKNCDSPTRSQSSSFYENDAGKQLDPGASAFCD
jgi:hypothetical protein